MRWLPLGLAIAAFLIVITGGWIRISEAGESCPEWPTCFGRVHPFVSAEEQADWWSEHPNETDSRGIGHRYSTSQIFSEWFHRLLVLAITPPLLAMLFLSRSLKGESGLMAQKMSIWATLLLGIQAGAGYVTVEMDNEPWTVALHLLLSQTFIAILLATWINWSAAVECPNTAVFREAGNINQKYAWIISASIFIVLGLGALVSKSSAYAACGVGLWTSWPLCNGSLLPSFEESEIILQFLHRFAVLVVGITLILTWRKTSNSKNGLIKTGTILYIGNALLAALFLVLAKSGYPSEVSLLHLIIGAAALQCWILISICKAFPLNPLENE